MGRLALTVTVALTFAVAAVAPVTSARAQAPAATVRARLEQGRAFYGDQEYRKAIRELSTVVEDPAATRAEKLEALELLGLCWFIVGDERRAREAFEDLLAIDPGHELREDTGSPKIRAFFDRVKIGFVPGWRPGRAALEHDAPVGAVAGRAVEVTAHLTLGVDVVREVKVRWRRRGEMAYHDAPMRAIAEGRLRARFSPPADPAGYVLEYYLEARDIAGVPLARVGGPETPLSLPLAGAPALTRPWYRRWPVWAGAGLAIGAAVVVGIAVASDEAPAGSLPPGIVDLGR